MASQETGDDSNGDSVDSVTTDMTVPFIFERIFDEYIKPFKERLANIKENKFGDVWSGEREKHDKTMRHARNFISNVVDAFRTQYDSVNKEVDGSACDKFQQYIHKKLNQLKDKYGMLMNSLDETKKDFDRRISVIKESFEKKDIKVITSKSDIYEAISNTELMDPVHINHALLCCRVAYECKDLEKPERYINTFADKHWLSELVVSHENAAVPRYVMARSGNVLYVAFRGLASTVCATVQGSVRPNVTWMGQTNSIIFEEAEKVPLGYFAREIIRNKRIIFTGHSTGGAIASLAVISLLDKLRGLPLSYLKTVIKCITFGITPVGDKRLKEFVESIPARKECFCHIVKDDDIIPKLFGSNLFDIQNKLLELVVDLVKIPVQMMAMAVLPASVGVCWSTLIQCMSIAQNAGNEFFPLFDIFGKYYILHPAKGSKYTVCADHSANDQLKLQPQEITEYYKDYLINHKIERYDNDVRDCLVNEYPMGLKDLKCGDTKKPKDILPVIEGVQFENFGGEVVAKVNGKDMWFVYEVTIHGVEPLSDDHGKKSSKTKATAVKFPVDISKSTESIVEINMGRAHLAYVDTVNVRPKMHFQDPKYMKGRDVPGRTTPYDVSKRQEQMAKLSPSKVIELAYMSALLERRITCGDDGKDDSDPLSKRYSDVKAFFESVISVVPAESLFHAMAVSNAYTVWQCCEMLSANVKLFQENDSSKFLTDGMHFAKKNLAILRHLLAMQHLDDEAELSYTQEILERRSMESMVFHTEIMNVALHDERTMKKVRDLDHNYVTCMKSNPLKMAEQFIENYLESKETEKKLPSKRSLCGLNLEDLYTASQDDVRYAGIEHPLTLLKNGRDELNSLSEEMSSQSNPAANANSEMLEKLNDLCGNFRTCSALLGSFMEAHVHVPLELQDDKQARKIATAAESGGLKVWALLILPVSYVKRIIARILEGSQKLLVDVTSYMRNLYGAQIDSSSFRRSRFPGSYYAGKLEFLMTSMKKSSSSNKSFIAYSLERQLVEECKKRNIDDMTSLDEILQQWEANFEDEVLTMVDENYRPMIARWIKWSLMINRLRESLAAQTAVGVIGLVNSGKSKFVRSMFGIKTITGTVAEKRTTVPFIYNIDKKIEGLDVIDFPGVDDKDKSIPELATLLLSLTRIVVFVVDYKRAHTEATAQWLKILEEENVPVLVCLSFADKLFSEHMSGGRYPDNSEVKSALSKQLCSITDQIGQPKHGKRDFEFVVFDLDNDSCLNSDEGKQKLVQAGLYDEIKVGRWIAEKLRDNQDNELATRVLSFITKKKSSTLNLHEHKSCGQKRSQPASGKTAKKGVHERHSSKIKLPKQVNPMVIHSATKFFEDQKSTQ